MHACKVHCESIIVMR